MQLEITPPNKIRNYILLPLLFICFALTSPKWNIALAPWLAFPLMIRFFRQNKWWKAILLGWLISYLAALVASWKVVPLPLPILFVFSLVSTGFLLIPYVLDKWISPKIPNWTASLVFPCSMVIMDYIASRGGGGTWGNIAYLQFSNIYLMQLASVTGIWGISFMVYWSGSTLNHIFENWGNKAQVNPAFKIFTMSFALVMGFGILRIQTADSSGLDKIKVAAITTENLSVLETIYECHTGEQIQIPPRSFQSDPELSQAFASMAAFVEKPFEPQFKSVFDESDKVLQSLWSQSEQAAQAGAKIIAWTEGIVNSIKSEEEKYIGQAQAFARQHQIWLLFPMASLHPGQIKPGKAFIENKVLTINPQGRIVNTYFKNIPVGGVEPCFPGDGSIPLIPNEYANISPVICYDADFPQLLRQVGQQDTELLIVPSGDWDAISPIHSYMAITRAIENGVSILRPVSKGLTIAADPYGQIIHQDDYFEDDQHTMLAEITPQKVNTIYAQIGDAFVYACIILLFGLLTSVLFWKNWSSSQSLS